MPLTTLTKKTEDLHCNMHVNWESAERAGQGRCGLVPDRSLADIGTQYLEEGKCCLASPSVTVAEQP